MNLSTRFRAPAHTSISALLVSALLAAGAGTATAEDAVYTGCLGPGGNLIHVAEGDQPAKQCAPSFTQITWNERGMDGMDGVDGVDGVDGQDGVSGYEILGARSLFFSWPVGEVRKLQRDCPEGKVVLGGGVFVPDPAGGAVLVVLSSAPTTTTPPGWLGKVVNLGTSDDVGGAGAWAVDVTCADIAED